MMHKTKLLSLILFVSAFSIHSAYSYTHTIANKTDGIIQVSIEYKGNFCSDDLNRSIGVGEERVFNAKLCCTKYAIGITKLTGKNAGARTSFATKVTGFGLGCASSSCVVQDLGRTIIATTPEDA